MDSFSEQLIKRRKTTLEKVMVFIMGVMAAILIVMFIILAVIPGGGAFGSLFTFFGLLLAAGAGYLAYFVITGTNIEFEYTITNGSFDVDKIIAQRKRKRLLSVELKDFEKFGVYVLSEHAQKKYDQQIHAAGGWGGPYYFGVVNVKGKGTTLVVFEPNEKTLGLVKKFLPRQVAIDAFGRNGLN